jgi:hypothetical protein
MFVIKVGTISAVLFTLVVMLLGKTVAGKHVRQAVASDPVDIHLHDPMTKNEHHDWTKDTIRSLQTAITSCDVPGEGPIASKWIGDTCFQSDFWDCCGPLLTYTSCDAYERWPGKWSNGVCSGYEGSDCCVIYTGYTYFIFDTCDAPDAQLPGQWGAYGTCTALSLSGCCGPVSSTTSSGNGGTTSSGNGGTTSSGYGGSTSRDYGGTTSNESSSGGLIVGIVVVLLIIAVLVTLISCARCPSCPWYSKMNCFPKNQPSPTTDTTASCNDPIKEVDTEDRSITEEPESAAPESNGPTEAHTNIERLSSVLASAGKIYHTVSSVSSTVESVTASVNNVAQFVAAVNGVQAEQTVY